MLDFSSARERRLWIYTVLLVVGIYLTLGSATILAEKLQTHGLSTGGFLLAMILVAVTVLTQGLKVRPSGSEIGVAIGIGVVYFMVLLRMTFPERSHLIEYTVVAVFIDEALNERRSQGRRVILPSVIAFFLTIIISTIDELIQLWLPNRHFERDDILFNCLAAFMATLSLNVLRFARRQVAP